MTMTTGLPLIFDIKRFALDDGPGIRTTVFFKGCPLACQWCHNPESISLSQEIAFYPKKCINCGDCQSVCPENAIEMGRPERIDRSKCSLCNRCIDICPSTALKSIGKYFAVTELVRALMKDNIFFDTSNGGVTFSGGEPLFFIDYLEKVIKKIKKENIHIAIQTAGLFDIKEFKSKILSSIDLIYFDIKFIDPVLHKKYTGRNNSQILENFLELVSNTNVQIIPRVPLIPGITTGANNLIAIANFLKRAGCTEYQLLPFNSVGRSKDYYTGKPSPLNSIDIISEYKRENEWRRTFADHFFWTSYTGKHRQVPVLEN